MQTNTTSCTRTLEPKTTELFTKFCVETQRVFLKMTADEYRVFMSGVMAWNSAITLCTYLINSACGGPIDLSAGDQARLAISTGHLRKSLPQRGSWATDRAIHIVEVLYLCLEALEAWGGNRYSDLRNVYQRFPMGVFNG